MMNIKSILTIAAVAAGFLASNPAQAATLNWSNADGLYWDGGVGTWGSVPVFDPTVDVVMGGVTTTKAQCLMSYNGQFSPTLRSITFNALFGTGGVGAYNLKIQSRLGDPLPQTMTFAADSGNSTFTVDSGFGFDQIRVALGTLALNNDLDVVQNDTDTELLFDLPVTGVGGINKSGAGLLTLNGAATYDGDTVVSAGTVTITNGITFKIGTNGANNQISGTGAVELEGAVSFNLAGAGLTLNDSWVIIDDASLSSLTANITSIDVEGGASFTEDSPGVWNVDANGRRYEYTESNHALIVTAAPVDTIRVETMADGSGDVVPAAILQSGQSITNYAIARDAGGAFIMNTPAAWAVSNSSGFVVDDDLSPAADAKSAIFTAGGFGSAQIVVDGNATHLVPAGLISVDAAPMTSTNRPFIWVKGTERAGILDKIASNAWMQTVAQGMIERVAPALSAYESDPDAFLRELPINWSNSPPVFYYGADAVRAPLSSKLANGIDCAVLYYLTGNSRYARCAADIAHNVAKSLAATPWVDTGGIDGWLFDEDMLLEARVIGNQLPVIYDFIEPYLQSNTVYDIDSAGSVPFAFADAQTVFDTYWKLCRDRGYGGNNWSSLMGACMIHNILGLEDPVARNDALNVYLYTGSPRQDSLSDDHSHFDQAVPYSIYPESLGYASAVVNLDTYYMALIERVDPSKTLFSEFSRIPECTQRIKQLNYPNHKDQILYGDGHRETTDTINYFTAELIYQHAKALGRTDLMDFNGGLITEGLASGKYDRSALKEYEALGTHNEPLQLLWFDPEVTEDAVTLDVFRTDTVPYAGIALQRNFSPNGDPDYGLMSFVGGAAFVHGHASGMNMELYGMGEVLGVKTTGRDAYGYSFASHNTVVVNGYSRGDGGWVDIAINTAQVETMEPATRQSGVSSNISFSSSSFLDNRGTGAEAVQQRTMAIVRTSPTTGYYVDIFRSDSSLVNEYHDYIYHNIADSLTVADNSGTPLNLTSAPNRFTNDTDVAYWGIRGSPGWGAYTNTMASATVTNSVRARFTTQFSGSTNTIYMDLHIPGDDGREYALSDSPASVRDTLAPAPYETALVPTLVVRKTGEAWNTPFATIFEPHHGTYGTVQNVTTLEQDGVVVGMKVESLVDGSNITQYVISNPGANDVYSDPAHGLFFTGRFAVVTDRGDGSGELYLGEGAHLAFGALSVTAVSGSNTQASVLFDANGPTRTTANDPVHVEWGASVSIHNAGAETITKTSADLTGFLSAIDAVSVTAYWSTNNNSDVSAWLSDPSASSMAVGTYPNAINQAVAVSISSLSKSTIYYYTLVASDASNSWWASPNIRFSTDGIFYLQARKPYTSLDQVKSDWWDAPMGGAIMAAEDVFPGNRFDLNRFTYQTKNTTSVQSFAGTMVNSHSDSSLYIYSGGFDLAGLDWSAAGTRLGAELVTRKDNIKLNITDLSVANTMIIRANSIEKNLDLYAATLTGDGTIRFGIDNTLTEDGGSIWGLDVDNSAFAGTIEINVGNLLFNGTISLPSATLSVVAGSQLTTVILSNNATFAAMNLDGDVLEAGTYTAAQLDERFGETGRFAGSGSLTVLTGVGVFAYEEWLALYPTLGRLTGYGDDFEPDGMNNLAEYALGGNPTNDDAAAVLPVSSVDASWLTIVYDRRAEPASLGLTYTVLTGTNLVDGSVSNIVPDHGVSPAINGFQTVTNRISTTTDDQAFVQLEVEISE